MSGRSVRIYSHSPQFLGKLKSLNHMEWIHNIITSLNCVFAGFYVADYYDKDFVTSGQSQASCFPLFPICMLR